MVIGDGSAAFALKELYRQRTDSLSDQRDGTGDSGNAQRAFSRDALAGLGWHNTEDRKGGRVCDTHRLPTEKRKNFLEQRSLETNTLAMLML
jgi:hypothetical protein